MANISAPFEVEFDDFKRKLESKNPNIYLNKLAATQTYGPEYEAWLGAFTLPENTTLEAFTTLNGKFCTFYTILTDPHEIELKKARELAKLQAIEDERKRDGVSA